MGCSAVLYRVRSSNFNASKLIAYPYHRGVTWRVESTILGPPFLFCGSSCCLVSDQTPTAASTCILNYADAEHIAIILVITIATTHGRRIEGHLGHLRGETEVSAIGGVPLTGSVTGQLTTIEQCEYSRRDLKSSFKSAA